MASIVGELLPTRRWSYPSDYTCRSYPILPVKKDQVFHPDFCLSSTKRTPNNGSFRIQKKSNPVFGFYVSLSSDPESHPKVGFESVSGFWFRVSGFVDWNQLSLSVSGFGFRVSGFVDWNQLSLSVSGFGFRVSSIETNFRCRFRVSGLGFRVSSIETNFRCRFRVSGFGFQVSSIETNFRCRFRVSGFGFRRLKPTFAVGFGFRVSRFETNFNSRFRVSGFGFRSVLGKVSLQRRSWGR